jgi:hypothetical protein
VLSPIAFHVASIVVLGEVTAHVLALGLGSHVVDDESVDILLLSALSELAESGLLEWEEWEAYGDGRPIRRSSAGADVLVDSWVRCFGRRGPRGEDPSVATLSLSMTERGIEEVSSPSYELYRPLLESWFDPNRARRS